MHVTDFLKVPRKQPTGPMVVLAGGDRFLKQSAVAALSELVLGSDDEAGPTRFGGKEVDLVTVRDELFTRSMFGDRRLVLIEGADEFVTAHRAGLEKYLDQPAKKSVLVLDVNKWPKNTRLAKAVARAGLPLECDALSGAALATWLCGRAGEQHGKQLSRNAASLLVELAGNDLGLLDQELAKLAAYAGSRPKIELDEVRRLVGGWKAETTFAMTAAVRKGNLALALVHLEKLLAAGEAPLRILGGVTYVFRKLAQATELSRAGMGLQPALREAGVFPGEISGSADYLRRIGRQRAEQISGWLLSADENLKGRSRLPERLELEQLLVFLSGKA